MMSAPRHASFDLCKQPLRGSTFPGVGTKGFRDRRVEIIGLRGASRGKPPSAPRCCCPWTPQPRMATVTEFARLGIWRRPPWRAGSLCRDPGAIHHGNRNTRLRIIQDQQTADVGKFLRHVLGKTAHPFHAGRAHLGYISRHGVNERVGKRMDAGLGRHFHATVSLFNKHFFDRANHFRHRNSDRFHVCLGKIKHGQGIHFYQQ